MGLTKDYLRYEHSGSCNSVGSVNGAIVAVDSTTCAITACENLSFYNMRTAEKVYEISDSTKAVTCVKFNKDKRWLAIGYADGTIRVYDRKAEEQTSVVFSGHKKGVNCLAFSNDGLTLASGGKDCAIILWDIVSESGMFRLNGHKESVTHIEFTRNDQFLISSSKDTFVKFWSVASQSCFYTLLDNRSEVYSFCILRDEEILVTASTELELQVFQLTWLDGTEDKDVVKAKDKKKSLIENDKEEDDPMGDMQNRYLRVSSRGKLLRQCKGRALQLVVSPDEKLVACLGADKLVDIYRVFTSEESEKRLTKKLRTAKRKASDDNLQVSEDDVKKDVTVLMTRVGDYRTADKMKWMDFGDVVKRDKEEKDVLIYKGFCLMSKNTAQMVSMKFNTTSSAVIVEAETDLDQLGHRDDVRCLAVSASNSAMVSGGAGEVIVWNTHSLRPISVLRDDSMKNVVSILIATGDGHVVAGTKTGEIFLWELSSCELLEMRKGHEGAVWSVVATPDKQGFVSASADKKVKFWSYELVSEGTRKRLSIKEKRVMEVPDEALCCAISPDSKFIIVGLLNNTASVYFMDSLKFFVSLYGHSLPVTCVTISPNSKLAVTGSGDKSIKIWGLDFGDCHKSFHAHDDVVSCVLFSPSEEMLVWSAGKDGKVKQWDAQKWERVQVLDRHTGEVRALAQTDTGSLLFSTAHDKSIRCWELTEEMIILQEEEEMEREQDYEKKLADDEDVVPGEGADTETGLATTKTTQSIVSTENIIEAVDIVRKERVARLDNPDHKEHPLIGAYKSKSLDHFILDTIARCRPSNVERSLLMVPLSYVSDILLALSQCVQKHYKIEFASRIAIFLIRIHHSHMINSIEALPVLEKLRSQMPTGIEEIRDVTGMNLAALQLLQLEIEEAQDIKLFGDFSQLSKMKKPKKKTRKALVKTKA